MELNVKGIQAGTEWSLSQAPMDAERILPDLISDVVDDTNEIFDLLKKEGSKNA